MWVSLFDLASRVISKSIFLGLLRDKRRLPTRTLREPTTRTLRGPTTRKKRERQGMEGIVRVVVFLFLVRTYFVCFAVAGVTGNGMAGLIFSRGTFFNHSKVSNHHAFASPHDPYSSSEAIVHLWFSNESKRSLLRWEREMFLCIFGGIVGLGILCMIAYMTRTPGQNPNQFFWGC